MKKMIFFLCVFALSQLQAQSEIHASGNWCDQTFELALSSEDAPESIQWFKDGLLLEGQTNKTLNCTTYGNGTFAVEFKKGEETYRLEKKVSEKSPVADFTAENYLAAAVTVFKDASLSDEAIISWHWDFGNGETSDEQHPKVMYSEQKTYTITLTVTTESGCVNQIQKQHKWAYE